MIVSKPGQVAATLIAVAFAVSVALHIHARPVHASDKPPVVKILAPQNNTTYKWNTLVNYSIVVNDRGKSTKYQEIPLNEVLLQATYVPDLSDRNASSVQSSQSGTEGVSDIIRSNCLGCHQFKSKAMGPSFSAIAERYPHSETTISTLSQHIHDGSAGMWGQARMPAHPEFTENELHAIATWIMDHSADPNVNYYVGTEGTFHMEPAGKPGPKAGLILIASYTSHGTADPQQTSRGEDTIVIHGQ